MDLKSAIYSKNVMMLKMENQKTTRFVAGQNISGLKIKS